MKTKRKPTFQRAGRLEWLTFYTQKSECTFSILFLYIQEWFVWQLRASSVGDHFLYPCDLPVWFMVDSVGRNKMLVSSKWLKGCHHWVKYSIWQGERLVQVCWTTDRAEWSNINAMDTKLKISLSHRTPSVTIQTCGLPGLQSLLKMESQDWIT